MAQSQDISVARAVFISALLRSESNSPDISRDDATLFAKTLLRTCNICSRSNIKLCKSFIVKTVLPSRTRTAALAKYLVTLSKSCPPRDADAKVDTTKPGDENEGLGKIINGKFPQPPEPAFRRLHILYILHDVLVFIHHHLARSRHSYESSIGRVALDQLRPAISTLAELAACGCSGKASKSCPYVLDLITFWKTMQIFPPNDLDDLRDRVLLADTADWDSTLSKLAAEDAGRVEQQRKDEENESQWILPDRHGVINDPTAPWHELPAANGLYMKRTRGYPLRAGAFPQGGFSLKNGGNEAGPHLQKDIETLYTSVLRCHDKYTNASEVQDIDALGNIIWKDPDRPTRNYWGFTLDGIDKRKELAERFAETATGYDPFEYEPVPRASNAANAVERARALASERGRGVGRGGRGGERGRADWRGGRW